LSFNRAFRWGPRSTRCTAYSVMPAAAPCIYIVSSFTDTLEQLSTKDDLYTLPSISAAACT
jgi:hypothetical protein